MPRPRRDNFDGPWKEALERFFPAFLAFFFPQAYAEVDWSRGYDFLDQELRRVTRGTRRRQGRVDKLVRVWRKDGSEAWVLVHVEVQNQPEAEFPRRMFRYNTRILDQFDRPVASFAILGDDRPDWRPDRFEMELWGCRSGLTFPTVKLLDYAADLERLEQDPNPFSVVVLAHLQTQATRRDDDARLEWKLRLVRGLYRRGYTRDEVLGLFAVIDWLMALPEELERTVDHTVEQLEGEAKVPYVLGIERRAEKRGREQGRKEGHEEGLEKGILNGLREAVLENLSIRHTGIPAELPLQLERISDQAQLRILMRQAVMLDSLDEFLKALRNAIPPAESDHATA